MKKFKIIVIVIVLLLSLIVILQNMQSVSTNFIFWEFSLPGAFLLFLTFMFGFIAGLLTAIRFEGKSEKKREVISDRNKT
jgi:uncharacterized integral membrane protein